MLCWATGQPSPLTLPAQESDLQPRVGQLRGRENDHRQQSLQNTAHGAGGGGPRCAPQFPAFSPGPARSEDQKLNMGAAEGTCRIGEQHPRGCPSATLLRRGTSALGSSPGS